MDDDLYSECEKSIKENRKRYEKLLSEVVGLAKHVREHDSLDRLYRVYSRKDNKNEESDFKKTSKVAEKLAKWRKNYDPKSRPEDLHDIIGITIVVRYNSDIEAVYGMIMNACQSRNLRIIPYLSPDPSVPADESRQYKKFGYHARHLVLSSTTLTLGELKCEVQIKTLLHDAWGAKTYSLVYKPPGELTDELRTIMEGFGESLQALEILSELVRTAITRDWNEENELRYTARLAMLSSLEEKGFTDTQLAGSL